MLDLVPIDTDSDVVDIDELVSICLVRSWSMASRTDEIDLYIVHIPEFVFAFMILPPAWMVVLIRLNAPFVTHSVHLQCPFELRLLGIAYAGDHQGELAFYSLS